MQHSKNQGINKKKQKQGKKQSLQASSENDLKHQNGKKKKSNIVNKLKKTLTWPLDSSSGDEPKQFQIAVWFVRSKNQEKIEINEENNQEDFNWVEFNSN